MKFLFPCFSLALILFAGCASSERMSRMSGGVVQGYSTPKENRIQSQRFREKARAFNSSRTAAIGGIEDTPVNIWPFYFGSAVYTSIAWPLIDWDDYGFAIRPLYNQEADERAVLFPLSAWNPVNGDGWVLLFAWNPKNFGLIPFSWQHEDENNFWCYYTPFFIRSKDKAPLSFHKRDANTFTECLLVYCNVERELDTRYWDQSLDGEIHGVVATTSADRLKAALEYKLAGAGREVPPADQFEALKALRGEVVADLPVVENSTVGFFPLFHLRSNDREISWRALCYLIGGSGGADSLEWDILGPFGAMYSRSGLSALSTSNCSTTSFLSLPMMSGFYRKAKVFGDDPVHKAFSNLRNMARKEPRPQSISAEERAEIEANLRAISPELALPESVTTNVALTLFLNELEMDPRYADSEPETRTASLVATCLPLFYYASDPESSLFWSIPLLTYHESDAEGAVTAVAPPFIWYSARSNENPGVKSINPADAKWVDADKAVATRLDYSLLGLYYRRCSTYLAAKSGVDSDELGELLRELQTFADKWREMKQQMLKSESALNTLLANETELPPDPTPDEEIACYSRKLNIATEKRKQNKLALEFEKLENEYAALENLASEFNFRLDGSAKEDLAAAELERARLRDACTELRHEEATGCSIFYRGEEQDNGNGNWHLFWFLANGEKDGENESCHVLQLLYRYRSDGKSTEKLYFPFISIREDETGRRFSFMGRVYQRTTQADKTTGYFLFIPY